MLWATVTKVPGDPELSGAYWSCTCIVELDPVKATVTMQTSSRSSPMPMSRPYPLALDASWLVSMMFADWVGLALTKVVPEFTAVPEKTPAAETEPSSNKRLSIIMTKAPYLTALLGAGFSVQKHVAGPDRNAPKCGHGLSVELLHPEQHVALVYR